MPIYLKIMKEMINVSFCVRVQYFFFMFYAKCLRIKAKESSIFHMENFPFRVQKHNPDHTGDTCINNVTESERDEQKKNASSTCNTNLQISNAE